MSDKGDARKAEASERAKEAEYSEGEVLVPQSGRQEAFLSSSADITVYGGGALGGKTFGLLLEAIRHVGNPGYRGIIFRRTYPQITQPGGMWDESYKIYLKLGGEPISTYLEWRFPSGAIVRFAHMQREADKYDYQGGQFAFIGFDQLEAFEESQFFYLLSRNRSTCGVRPYLRATCNPDADSWLANFLSWWIADDGYADLSKEGRVRWFARIREELVWADSREELVQEYPDCLPKSVSFIPATIYDNPILMQKDPGYLANLQALPLVDRERLLGDARRGGNWHIRPAAGKVFNRAWFEIIPQAPEGGVECRGWDFAATRKALAKGDPDFTASVKIRRVKGVFYVTDCYAAQIGPARGDEVLKSLAYQDREEAGRTGTRYLVRWEQEPAASGKRDSYRLVKMLAGFDARGVYPGGDKLTRARPLAAQAYAGNVRLVRGPWNERWLNHMHNQPELPHDDIMDASVVAFNALVRESEAAYSQPPRQPFMGSRWAKADFGRRKQRGKWSRMR